MFCDATNLGDDLVGGAGVGGGYVGLGEGLAEEDFGGAVVGGGVECADLV